MYQGTHKPGHRPSGNKNPTQQAPPPSPCVVNHFQYLPVAAPGAIEIGHMCFMCGTDSQDGFGSAVSCWKSQNQRIVPWDVVAIRRHNIGTTNESKPTLFVGPGWLRLWSCQSYMTAMFPPEEDEVETCSEPSPLDMMKWPWCFFIDWFRLNTAASLLLSCWGEDVGHPLTVQWRSILSIQRIQWIEQFFRHVVQPPVQRCTA